MYLEDVRWAVSSTTERVMSYLLTRYAIINRLANRILMLPVEKRRETVVSGVVLVAFYSWFLYHISGGLTSWFSDDDLQNLHYYWTRSWGSLLRGNVLFFTDYYRPLGGVFYKGLYGLFGMTPLPGRVCVLALCMFNIWLLYRLVERLAESLEVRVLTLVLVGFHASFVSIYYDSGMIYDVLAFTCYVGAILIYVTIRSARRLNVRDGVIVVGLQICALNSKEIAASLPVAIVLYELLWHGLPFGQRRHVGWRGRNGRLFVIWIMIAVNALWMIGKVTGSDSLIRQSGYHPNLALSTYLDVYARYVMQFCYWDQPLSRQHMAMSLVAIVMIGIILKSRFLCFSGVMIVVCPLPIAFIPARGGFAFYLPAIFWAMWFAGCLSSLRLLLIRGVRYGVKLSEQRWAYLDALTAIVVCGVAGAYVIPLHERMFRYPLPLAQILQNRNHEYAKQIVEALPRLTHGARILVRDDPYSGYQVFFLIQLLYNDKTVVVDQSRIQRELGVRADVNSYDYVVTFVGSKISTSHS